MANQVRRPHSPRRSELSTARQLHCRGVSHSAQVQLQWASDVLRCLALDNAYTPEAAPQSTLLSCDEARPSTSAVVLGFSFKMEAPLGQAYNPDVGEAVAERARIALGRTGLANASGTSVTRKSGFLLKRGPLRVWQRRWFVLENNELSYFRSHAQYERFKINAVRTKSTKEKIAAAIPCFAGCLHVRNRGISAYNEAAVADRDHVVGTVSDDAIKLTNPDLDFSITIGNKQIMCRATSIQEKRLWVIALNSATTVRSYTSRELLTSSTIDLQIKNVRLEDLDLGEILGSGTTGTVKLAVHIPTGMRVAVKIISKKKFFLQKSLEKDMQEELAILEQLSKFDHEHIVHMWGHCQTDTHIYIVMELCEGGELMEHLEHVGNYSEADAAALTRHMAEVLMYLHDRNIVHRDIKPENLLIADKTNPNSVKMADFGLANMMENTADVAEGKHETMCGTPAFMAPEVYIDGNAALDPKTDMWSLGVVVYMLLCGHPPFKGSIAEIRKQAVHQQISFVDPIWRQISDAAKDLILHLILVDPSKRFDAQQVLEHPWITGESQNDIVLTETIRKLALFNAKKKFKGLAHAMVATNRMKSLFGGGAKSAMAVTAMAAKRTNEARVAAAPWSKPLLSGAGKYASQALTATSGFVDKGLDAVGAASNVVRETGSVAVDSGAAVGSKVATHSQKSRLEWQAEGAKERRERNQYFAAVRMNMVSQWLYWQGLDTYAVRFHDEGYDDIEVLKELSADEIEEVLAELNIPPGHKGIMRAAIIDLTKTGWTRRATKSREERHFQTVSQDSVSTAESEVVAGPQLIFHGAETDREVLDRLFKEAMDQEHPGINVAGIQRMNEFIESGRFSISYYIAMWVKRLQDKNVLVTWPRRIAFGDNETKTEVLDRLLEVAVAEKVHGCTPKTVANMKQNIADTRFTEDYYIDMWKKRLEDAGFPVFLTKAEADTDAQKRKRGHDKRVQKAKAKAEAAAAEQARKLKEAEEAAKARQKRDAQDIVNRRKELERMAREWDLGSSVSIEAEQLSTKSAVFEQDHRLQSLDEENSPANSILMSKQRSRDFDTSQTAATEQTTEKSTRTTRVIVAAIDGDLNNELESALDYLETWDGVGSGGHMAHDSVSDFDATSWTLGNSKPQKGKQNNSLVDFRAHQAMHGMHEDRIDGPLFATEMNNYDIDIARGQDPITHSKITTTTTTTTTTTEVRSSFARAEDPLPVMAFPVEQAQPDIEFSNPLWD